MTDRVKIACFMWTSLLAGHLQGRHEVGRKTGGQGAGAALNTTGRKEVRYLSKR